jgi:hypothetical protein
MMKFFFLLFTVFLFLSSPSLSQSDSSDVDMTEPDNKDDKDEDDEKEKEKEGAHQHIESDENNEKEERDSVKAHRKFKYRVALDGIMTKGNVNRSLITFRNIVTYEKNKFTINMNTYAATGSQSKSLAEEELLNNLTIHHNITKRFYLLGINTFEHSHLRGINLRWQAGGGLGFNIWKSDTNSLTISNAFLYESTDFRKIEDIRTVRNSTRLKGQHSFRHKHLLILHETFFQPSIIDISNITFRTNITISIPVSKLTSIRFTCNDSYETIIQPGKKHNDLQLTFGFSIAN